MTCERQEYPQLYELVPFLCLEDYYLLNTRDLVPVLYNPDSHATALTYQLVITRLTPPKPLQHVYNPVSSFRQFMHCVRFSCPWWITGKTASFVT